MVPFVVAAAAGAAWVPAPAPGPGAAPAPAPGVAPAPDSAPDSVAPAPFVVAPPQPGILKFRTQQCFPLGHIPVAGTVFSSPFLHAFLQLPSLFAHFLTYQLPAERRASHQAWVLSGQGLVASTFKPNTQR